MEKEEEKENNGGVIKKTRIWETVRKQTSLEGFFVKRTDSKKRNGKKHA